MGKLQEYFVVIIVAAVGFMVFSRMMLSSSTSGSRSGHAQHRRLETQLKTIMSMQEAQSALLHNILEKDGEGGGHSCVDKESQCPNWANCCPGKPGGGGCGKQDCPTPGAPCTGEWMAVNCRLTCGTCTDEELAKVREMAQHHAQQLEQQQADAAASKKEPILALWEREKKDNGTIADGAVKWRMWHRKDPRVLYLENLITSDMADAIVEMARPLLQRSKVVHSKNESEGVDAVRTSHGMWLSNEKHLKHPARKALVARLAEALDVPVDNFEAVQILRYEAGQYYIPHTDWFDPGMKEQLSRGGQRIATSIVFLNTLPEGAGGTTRFPDAVGGPVEVKPKKGDGILFYDTYANRVGDPASAHEAVPPKKGYEKWVAVLWCRETTFY